MAQQRITGPTMEDIIKDARSGRVAPVYVLAGTEPYFIDSLSGELAGLLMPEQNRDFDMSLFYGLETDANRIIEACRQFPLLGDRRVVLVREAQQLRGGLEALEPYCKTPSEKTVLILCFKGVDDIRKGAAKAAKALAACGGVIYESKKCAPGLHHAPPQSPRRGHRAQSCRNAGGACGHRPLAHGQRAGEAGRVALCRRQAGHRSHGGGANRPQS